MNCKQVQELLPLYVGRDLEEKRAKLITAHVQSCAQCAGLADEYRATQQLLQVFTPPPFSEAVYAGIRQRVLREIGRESTAPTLPQLVASLFRPRLRWAIATALLLAVSMFAFYFVTNRTNHRQQVADGGGKVDGPRLPSSNDREGQPPASTVHDRGPVQVLAGGIHPSPRRKSPGVAGRPGSHQNRSMIAKASPKSNNLAEPHAVRAAVEKTFRVEMQTKDRNIRIIWFSHQRTKQDSPGESFKSI